MNYVWAFVVGGAICVIGQLFIDYTKLTPARILTGYVVAGVVLSAVGVYKPLAEFAGAGASVPLLGFGHLLAQGVVQAVDRCGLPGAFTGDLGQVGSDLLCEQMEKEGVPLPNHYDCGCLLYDVDSQNVQAGGSGAGCSAAVLCAWVLPRLFDGRFKRVLFLSTGALMSQTTFLQGETIPGIAHCVELGGLV